jgi:hypothetical protein
MSRLQIGTERETSLHAALKANYAAPGDLLEAPVDGYIIDIVRGAQLIEIQTGNFSGLRRKLTDLLARHPVRLVYPIAVDKWVVRLAADGVTQLSRRKSPKHGQLSHLFDELVYIPTLALHPNFSLEIWLIEEEVWWRDDGRGSWRRRGWSVMDHHLLSVVERVSLAWPRDYVRFLPELPAVFTVCDWAAALGQPVRLTYKLAYCLRQMGLVQVAGKQGRARLYRRRE